MTDTTDQEYADLIRHLTDNLNVAITKAHEAGICVTFDTIDMSKLTSPFPLQTLSPKIGRIL